MMLSSKSKLVKKTAHCVQPNSTSWFRIHYKRILHTSLLQQIISNITKKTFYSLPFLLYNMIYNLFFVSRKQNVNFLFCSLHQTQEQAEISLDPFKFSQTLLEVVETLVISTPDRVKSEQGVREEQLILTTGLPSAETELKKKD